MSKTQTVVTTNVEASKFDAKAYIAKMVTKSAAIRQLAVDGKTRVEIAKMLGIRYQHVRNVLITPIKKVVGSGRVGGMEDLTS